MQNKDQLPHYTHNNKFLKINTNDFYIVDIVDYLIENPLISKLEITNQIIKRDGIERLTMCASISSLTIINSAEELRLIDIIHISKNRNIKALNLEGCKLDLEGIKHIANSTSIKELVLAKCSINDEAVKILASNTIIKKLNLSDNNISDNGIEYLTDNKSIKEIDISHNPVSSNEIIEKLKNDHRSIRSDGIPSHRLKLR